jgi:hypothetical protein
VAALESAALTALAWVLSFASARALGHERRISELEASIKQLRADIDEVDLVVDRTLDAASVSRNGVLRQTKEVGK